MRCGRAVAAVAAAAGLLLGSAPAERVAARPAAPPAPVGPGAPVPTDTGSPVPTGPGAPAPTDPGSAALLDRAELVLAGKCMVAHGFAFEVPGQRPARSPDPNARYAASLPPPRQDEYLRTFFGERDSRVAATVPGGAVLATSTGGCLAQARRRLYGDFERWFAVDALLGNLTAAAPELSAAEVAWYRTTVAAGMSTARRLLATPDIGAPALPAVGAPSQDTPPAVGRYRTIGPGWNAGNCTGGYLCAYEGISASGPGVAFYADAWDWATIPGRYTWINNTSHSWVNLGLSSVGSVRLFQYAGGFGVNRCLRKGYWVDHDDELAGRVSANVWVRSCTGHTEFAGQAPGVPPSG